MKIRAYLTASLLVSAGIHAQTNLRAETQRQDWNADLLDIRVSFDSDPARRYLIEVSENLSEWAPHYLAPFEHSEQGHWVRQLDTSSSVAPKAEFYRAKRLPWSFQTLVNSEKWIGDLSLAGNGSTGFVVFQDRDSNELYFSESDASGTFATPTVIASTGAVDEPGFWDNSGFAEVTIHSFGNTLFLVCTDSIARKVILLWKHSDKAGWNRHAISARLDNHFWAFPKFAISDTGILGVTFAGANGTVFSYANSASPTVWKTVPVTSSAPSDSNSIQLLFGGSTKAHVNVAYDGSYAINTLTGAVTDAEFPEELPSDLTGNESEKIQSAYGSGSETPSKHIRLGDGRILFALSSQGRIVMAVED